MNNRVEIILSDSSKKGDIIFSNNSNIKISDNYLQKIIKIFNEADKN